MVANQTEKRKEEHIKAALAEEANYKKTTMLEYVEFIHNALPEVDFEKVDIKTKAFGREFNAPLLIVGMTGGFKKAEEINKSLAKVCEKFGIAFGVGSQRAMIEKSELKNTYYVRDVAPHVFLISNIGGYQLKEYSNEQIEKIVKDIDADALAIHLNPLQELMQPEGDRNWEGVERRIAEIRDVVDVPVIIKEVGTGISEDVAKRLKKIGIKWIDVSGSGGTSWGKVEILRGGKLQSFGEWGIPTALSILMAKKHANVIASGGIRNGLDGAKALALGAELFGAAKPFLQAYFNGNLEQMVEKWIAELKAALFLTGSKNLSELRKDGKFYIYGELREIAEILRLL